MIQSKLFRTGYHLRVDGVYGPITRDTVKDFQRKHAPLVVDGWAGKLTLEAMNYGELWNGA